MKRSTKILLIIIIPIILVSILIAFGLHQIFQIARTLSTHTYCRNVIFSPDNSRIAFFWEKMESAPLIEAPIDKWELRLYWCDITNINDKKYIIIDTKGREYNRKKVGQLNMQFSPNAEYIAICYEHHLIVVNLSNSECFNISSDYTTSYRWVENNVLVYVENTRLWRHEIFENPEEQTEIWADISLFSGECFSPRGNYIIFSDLRDKYSLTLLETKKGAKIPLNILNTYSSGIKSCDITWRVDESQFFIVGRNSDQTDSVFAFLYDIPSEIMYDCTNEWRSSFGDEFLHFRELWTEDHKFLVTSRYLIQPNPWEVIEVEEQIGTQLGVKDYPQYSSFLFRLPVPGWVGFCAVGYHGSMTSISAPKYAYDYINQQTIPILKQHLEYAISHDGEFTVYVQRNAELMVEKIDYFHQKK